MSLKGKVALVTGASRGCGRGIALSLGSAGATVYITSLNAEDEDEIVKSVQDKLPNLEKVAEEITSRGGFGIPIYCDHAKSDQVALLFERIEKEQNDQLDILVNCAFAAVTKILKIMHTKFIDLPENIYDTVMDVGLKGHYICARHAAKLMAKREKGLIVTISSFGGASYIFNVAYGIGKAGCDRLAADVSLFLWPGAVRTELFSEEMGILSAEHVKKHYKMSESMEFSGKCIVGLANDPKVMDKIGQILLVQELAKEYGVKEDDGSQSYHPQIENYVEFVKMINKYRQEVIM